MSARKLSQQDQSSSNLESSTPFSMACCPSSLDEHEESSTMPALEEDEVYIAEVNAHRSIPASYPESLVTHGD